MNRSLRTGLPAPRPGLTTLSSLNDRACVGSGAAKRAGLRGLGPRPGAARPLSQTRARAGRSQSSTGAPGRTSGAEPSARAWRHGSRALVLSPAGSLPSASGGAWGCLWGTRGARQGCAGKAMMTLLSCGHRARGAEDRADPVPRLGGGCSVPSLEHGSGAGWAGGGWAEGWCRRRLGAHGQV